MKEQKRSKYDTNPLDPDVAERADDAWGEKQKTKTETKERWDAEAPTKRYDSSIPFSYPSINVPPSYPPKRSEATAASSASVHAPAPARSVPGLGLPENITYALPYAPFFIGAIVSAVELLLTPRSEPRARFHASQALVLHLASIIISIILNIVGSITGSNVGGSVFWAVSTAFFIIAMIRVFKGEALHVAAADSLAQRLEERFDPQKHQKKK
jgi:uncharacterized membrane protein